MARLLTTGWETGDHSDSYGYTGYPGIETSSQRTGYGSLRIRASDWYPLRPLVTGVSEFYFGCAVKPGYVGSVSTNMFNFRKGTTAIAQLIINASGYLEAYRGGSIIATGTKLFTAGTWYYIQIHVKIDDSAGDFEVKVDSSPTLDIDFSGDTKPGTDTTVDNVGLSGWQSGSTVTTGFDDLVWNDTSGSYNNTWPGAVKLYPLRPNATGDSAQFTRGGTDRGNNYAQVDEVPSDHTDYLYSNTVDHKDLYNAGTLALPNNSVIQNIVVIANAYLDSGSGNISLGVKSSSSEDFSADLPLGSALHPYEYAIPLDPATAAAWGQSAVDSLQIGMKCR